MELKDFGKMLIEIRKSKGLTQDEVAEKCKITVRTIQRIESGKVKPRAYTIKILSESLEFNFFSLSKPISNPFKVPSKHSFFWLVRDLFNLKTHTMKKISILTTSITVSFCALFFFVADVRAQSDSQKTSNTPKSAIYATKDRLEVVFSNNLTLDSLISIQIKLKEKGIALRYTKLEFDKTDHLSGIASEVVFQKDGDRGSFAMNMLDSENKNKNIGFFINYSKNAKVHFGTGIIN